MIFIPPPPTSRQIGRKLGKLLATMRKLQTPVKPQTTTAAQYEAAAKRALEKAAAIRERQQNAA